MAAIEHYKKQAKLYLRWHRCGYFPAAAQIRRYLARFQHLTDKQILAHPFKLSHAQELVARKAGFDGWEALKKGIGTMPTSAVGMSSKVTLLRSEPQLFVSDLEAAFSFYVGQLGFEIALSYGEPPFYAQVLRGGARLNLRRTSLPAFDPAFKVAEPDALSATVIVDDAKALFAEFEGQGVDFHQRLRTEPWGARTFIVRDPDRNLVCFAGADS